MADSPRTEGHRTSWPALRGSVDEDAESLRWASEDWGGRVHDRPHAVLRPGSVSDVAGMVAFCARNGIPVVPRGQGHSSDGQAQSEDGVVIDMTRLSEVHHVGPDRIVVDGGARWSDVLAATLPHNLAPPVLTDYVEITVGGTLSVGGVGGATHRCGAQTDNVVTFEVVTPEGDLRTCSPDEDRDLFDAVRAGRGTNGTIVRATLPLAEVGPGTRVHTLSYRDRQTFLNDQRRVVDSAQFDHVQGHVVPGEDSGWVYALVAARYWPDDDTALLDALQHDEHDVEDLSHGEFLHRLRPQEEYLRSTGAWLRPHPWLNLFLPASAAGDFLAEAMHGLTADDLGEGGLVLVYPFPTSAVRTPRLELPEEPDAYLVAFLRTAPPDEEGTVRMIRANAELRARALAVGGTTYLDA